MYCSTVLLRYFQFYKNLVIIKYGWIYGVIIMLMVLCYLSSQAHNLFLVKFHARVITANCFKIVYWTKKAIKKFGLKQRSAKCGPRARFYF